MLDTIVCGATVVTAAGICRCTIAIDDGRIIDLVAPGDEPEAVCTIDASDKLVLPGVVALVFDAPVADAAALRALSAAAAFGGVTTLALHAPADAGGLGVANWAASVIYQDLVLVGAAGNVGPARSLGHSAYHPCGVDEPIAEAFAPVVRAPATAPPSSRDEGRPTIATLRSAEVALALSRFYTLDVRAGMLSLEQLAALIAAEPARAVGLHPRKGAIAVGSDADLVVIDPERAWTADDCRTAGVVPESYTLLGRPVLSLSRGRLLLLEDELKLRPGAGAVLRPV